jgi:hypothetical protein
MLAPTAGLAGAAPAAGAAAGRSLLPAAARRDLLARIGGPRRGRLTVAATRLGGRTVTKAIHQRGVLLGGLDRRLKGVIASAVESVLVGSSATRAVVLGELPDASTTLDEVEHFVGTLLTHGAILLGAPAGAAARKRAIGTPSLPTHAVRTRAGRKVLKRIRFACGLAGPRVAGGL